MSGKSWATFEEKVRAIASHVWGRPCQPQHIGGVDIDGVCQIDREIFNLVEITEERNLGKIRSDVVKLQTAKAALFTKGILARCYCVVNGSVTTAMVEAGEHAHIPVLSLEDFSKQFFDFARYGTARSTAPFGSAVNPVTGEADDTPYVQVRYTVDGRKGDINSADVAKMLREGQKVILLGEYGSGKSRCISEVFRHLAKTAVEDFCYPIAVDLRKSWGLTDSGELVRRHFRDLGLDNLESAAIRAFNAGTVAVLLDGFDEIGSQAWSNDASRLKVIRAKSLEGVKDTVIKNSGGTLIAGREHYFTSSEEMFQALGLKASDTVVIRSKHEFSDTELLEYFTSRDIEVDIPEWLPKRPLICQTISDLADDQFEKMFGERGNEVEFWNYFIEVLCKRDARTHVSFDEKTIYDIFVHLARLTRTKSSNVGPISLVELQAAFEASTGSAPVEEASIMLQRLPSLGRVSPESNDRQFVDVYILDGLRAKDVVRACVSSEGEFLRMASAKWTNALDDLGQRVLAADTAISENARVGFAQRALALGNTYLACDLVASLIRDAATPIDVGGIRIDRGEFLYFPLGEREVKNMTLHECYLGTLALPSKSWKGVLLSECVTPRVTGASSASALPSWVTKLHAEQYDSVASVSRIRRIGLGPAHEILITIIRKTFFQKGAGRKEEALLRGLGNIAAKGVSTKILNIMIREGLLTTMKGDEGLVYKPVRTNTQRMQSILDELAGSKDGLWLEVGRL